MHAANSAEKLWTGTAALSKDGTVQWHSCTLQPVLSSLRVCSISGVTCIIRRKKAGLGTFLL